jgi:predicted transposase YbfD/YdcC|tara:strand:+ start:280 stop:495 length:216 start_codon:yes stop_codon:yes gene_type:complete
MARIAKTLRNDMRTHIQIERKKAWEAEIVELNENLQSIYNPKWRVEILTKLKEAYISLAEVIEVEILSEKN